MSDDGSKHGDGSDHEEEETGLTKEEQDKCWEAFSAFDKDGSGYIDANELKIVLEMMG
jgi:Ca2+-binding EF-hand superfamily protein